MRRRYMLGLAASIAWTVTVFVTPAAAQDWPTKTVRVIVPFSPGSAVDLVGRAVFDQVSKQVGQNIIVENRGGGSGAPAIMSVKSADADGHTILVHSNSLITTPAIQAMTWDPAKDFSGITPLGNVPLVLVVAPEKNIKTLKELVDLAKAKPGTLNYAAAGIGSPPHLTMERFRIAAGFTGQLVPFKGAPEALTEIMAGRVDMYFCPLTPAMPLIRAGKLVPLAVSSTKRASALARRADHDRGGLPELRFRILDRLDGREADATPDRGEDARRDREGAGRSGHQGAVFQDGRRFSDSIDRRFRCSDRKRNAHCGRACESGRRRDRKIARKRAYEGRSACRGSASSGLATWACRWRKISSRPGHAVIGLDVSKAQVDKLVEAGGKAAGSVKEAASGVDVVITMLPAGAQVREVYLGNDGVVAAASQGTLLIDSSTIDVETARAVSSCGARPRASPCSTRRCPAASAARRAAR